MARISANDTWGLGWRGDPPGAGNGEELNRVLWEMLTKSELNKRFAAHQRGSLNNSRGDLLSSQVSESSSYYS